MCTVRRSSENPAEQAEGEANLNTPLPYQILLPKNHYPLTEYMAMRSASVHLSPLALPSPNSA